MGITLPVIAFAVSLSLSNHTTPFITTKTMAFYRNKILFKECNSFPTSTSRMTAVTCVEQIFRSLSCLEWSRWLTLRRLDCIKFADRFAQNIACAADCGLLWKMQCKECICQTSSSKTAKIVSRPLQSVAAFYVLCKFQFFSFPFLFVNFYVGHKKGNRLIIGKCNEIYLQKYYPQKL